MLPVIGLTGENILSVSNEKINYLGMTIFSCNQPLGWNFWPSWIFANFVSSYKYPWAMNFYGIKHQLWYHKYCRFRTCTMNSYIIPKHMILQYMNNKWGRKWWYLEGLEEWKPKILIQAVLKKGTKFYVSQFNRTHEILNVCAWMTCLEKVHSAYWHLPYLL